MLEHLLAGFATLMTPITLAAAALGLVGGIFVGALPGLTATMAVAVLAPFTFFIDATIGIPFLLGVYKGAIYGGSIPAITINTPGTAASAATAIDGNALANRGRVRLALETSLFASVLADLLSTVVLILVAAPLASIAISFGSSEFVLLYLFALTLIAGVSGNDFVKGLLSAAGGLLLAVIGLDPMTGFQRFTFGVTDLLQGISLVPLLIGMFALSEILIQAENGAAKSQGMDRLGGRGLSWRQARSLLPVSLRSTGIGTFLGALPGLGAEISCWISYGVAKRRSRRPQQFGKGSLSGICAAEAGNNAVVPAALIPMMVFGIPGDTITAVLLGAFMAHDLMPGPLLFERAPDLMYGFFAILLVTNIMLIAFGLLAIRHLRHINRIPQGLLYPAVVVLCFAGAFSVNNSSFDLVIMLAGGVLGYGMRKTGVPIPPLVIALLLAPGLENALRQTLLLSNGSLSIFVTRPISLVLLSLLVLSIVVMIWRYVAIQREAAQDAVSPQMPPAQTPSKVSSQE
ncbi:tripartite tricarboxylate transporter permease [Allohahella marinimesophila]|uniref:Tripartite tricarboxylate transporter permease n=1 Tax=Allohahella marinimesophila TaxID=1054972 RepID=A0ABP7NHB3_9GAMM